MSARRMTATQVKCCPPERGWGGEGRDGAYQPTSFQPRSSTRAKRMFGGPAAKAEAATAARENIRIAIIMGREVGTKPVVLAR